jgi:toxin ParE1/3/4
LIRYTTRALADLEKIGVKIAILYGQAVANRIVDRIFSDIEYLENFPRLVPEGRMPETHEMVISGYPYIVIYKLDRDGVSIYRIINSATPWPPPSSKAD